MGRFASLVGCYVMVLGAPVPDVVRAQEPNRQPPLTVASWGGAYTRAQMLAVIRPYREATGDWVAVELHEGSPLDDVDDQVSALNVTWDVVDLELPEAIRACDLGLLEPIDPSELAPPPGGGTVVDDFYNKTLQPCAVGQVVFATVVAYDPSTFRSAPSSVADLFDTERFPGPRALRRTPRGNLEWALLADGLPADQVYDVLDTSKGVARAFAMLDRINVIWWQDGDVPAQLLTSGLVTMASAWNGRIVNAIDAGANLEILWDANAWDGDFWGIVRGTERPDEARDFIRYATAPERLARMSDHIPYGPARRSAVALVDPEVEAELPTSAEHARQRFEVDYEWWARNGARLERRFEAWLRTAEAPIYDFNPRDRN